MLMDKNVTQNTESLGCIEHAETQLIPDFKMWRFAQILQNRPISQGSF